MNAAVDGPSFRLETWLTGCACIHQVLGVGAFGKVVRAEWRKAPPPGDSVRDVALK